MPPPPPASAPPEPAKKKGLHPLAWVGIGCGGLLVIAIIGVAVIFGFAKRKIGEFQEKMAANPHQAAAEMIVGMNPDLELVTEDETAGEMTIRVKSSGEEITVSYSDLAEGRFTVSDGQGTVTRIGTADLSQIPGWVPRYPNIASQSSVYHQEKPGGVEGVWVFSTSDTPEQVQGFFDAETSWSNSSSGGSTTFNDVTQLNREYSGGGRDLKLLIMQQGTGQSAQITLSYSESKP